MTNLFSETKEKKRKQELFFGQIQGSLHFAFGVEIAEVAQYSTL